MKPRKKPLFKRINSLSNNALCNVWNSLTCPSKARLDRAHVAANRAATYVLGVIKWRGFRVKELSNGMIFPADY